MYIIYKVYIKKLKLEVIIKIDFGVLKIKLFYLY